MAACCYNGKKRGASGYDGCQFAEREITKVGSLHFCRFHLPWSPKDLSERFGITVSENDVDRSVLKDRWDDSKKNEFSGALAKCLKTGTDLAGITAASDFDISDSTEAIVIPDAVFPSRFRINRRILRLELKGCTFCGRVEIGGSQRETLDITNGRFSADAIFSGEIYNAVFDRCEFQKIARFRNSKFYRRASFKKCQFNDRAQFERCDFSHADTISFDGAHFRGAVSFRAGGAPNIHRAFFRDAVFEDEVGFEGRHFQSSLIFRGARFSRAPRFQDTRISFEADFPKLDGFLDWRIVPKGIGAGSIAEEKEYYGKASQAYRTLRNSMKAQDAYEEEARFWELEMRAKEHELSWDRAGWLPKLFSRLYAASSRYGNSIGRPLVMWIIIWFGFAAAYAAFHIGFSTHNLWAYDEIADFSFLQTVRPFGVWSDEGAHRVAKLVFDSRLELVSNGEIFAIRLIATTQSVISLTCIALFGFALRRRFRMA